MKTKTFLRIFPFSKTQTTQILFINPILLYNSKQGKGICLRRYFHRFTTPYLFLQLAIFFFLRKKERKRRCIHKRCGTHTPYSHSPLHGCLSLSPPVIYLDFFFVTHFLRHYYADKGNFGAESEFKWKWCQFN